MSVRGTAASMIGRREGNFSKGWTPSGLRGVSMSVTCVDNKAWKLYVGMEAGASLCKTIPGPINQRVTCFVEGASGTGK